MSAPGRLPRSRCARPPKRTRRRSVCFMQWLRAAATESFTDQTLFALICRLVNLSLTHGNGDGSFYAYAMLGMIAGTMFGNYDAAFRFAQLGYDLARRSGWSNLQARPYSVFAGQVILGARHNITASPNRARRYGAPHPPIPQYPFGFFARYCW